MICLKNGIIHDAIHENPYVSDLLINGGKIVKIEKDILTDYSMEVIDLSGKHIYPGFIDAHSHIGTDGFGIGYEGQDYNEMNDIVSPQLRGIDAIQPMDESFGMAARAGVTSVATGPGSANVLGGTFVALKTVGKRVDKMVIKPDVAMKCAFGENPKRIYRDKGDSTRMSTASKLREMLFKAREYQQKLDAAGADVFKRPSFDMKLEALLPVLKKEMPLKAHAHQANDMFTALRIAHEFDVNITLEHVTEGHLIVEELAQENVPLAVGPSFGHATKFELRNKTWETPGILANAGCQVSIITDSPVIPQHYLPLCAGLAIKSGMKPFDALKAITINPAKHVGIDNVVGSIEEGKDADLVITDGSPFEVSTTIEKVLINGKAVE
ncbi:amidohydrolase [Anaerosporobacter faecicola]|uniref:amidohydrolase n=1 Tax=Anaerosporobacter faecicola TaxID=2718714 RepID=UPI0014390967|nr:amidohydrolase [Anaerosporobacter faecicola]